jgi:hypothetical protein
MILLSSALARRTQTSGGYCEENVVEDNTLISLTYGGFDMAHPFMERMTKTVINFRCHRFWYAIISFS